MSLLFDRRLTALKLFNKSNYLPLVNISLYSFEGVVNDQIIDLVEIFRKLRVHGNDPFCVSCSHYHMNILLFNWKLGFGIQMLM
jgi:hypothetical protein